MKLSCVSLALLLTQTNAFQSQKVSSSGSHLMAEKEDNKGWWAPGSVALVGWTLATQVAFGSTAVSPEQNTAPQPFQTNPSTVLAGFGSNVETLDFSLPSYGDSVKSSIPSFTPFGDVKNEPEEVIKPDNSAAEAAESKAAAEAKKAEEKAEAEAKKAEEKAAAEAKKEEEKAAAEAKKAEKEARKLAEKEKQRLAVERANLEKASQSVEEAAPVEVKIPDVSIPEMKIPEVKVPEMPDIQVPDIKVPDFKVPDIKVPSFSMPKLDLPNNVDLPKASEVSIPKFDAPKMPAVSLPKMDYDFSSPKEEDLNLEPQEVRDERAREARNVFLAADETAKDIERQAQELRAIANGKKELAKEAKDEACKTRFGGKFICLRGFSSGY